MGRAGASKGARSAHERKAHLGAVVLCWRARVCTKAEVILIVSVCATQATESMIWAIAYSVDRMRLAQTTRPVHATRARRI